MVVQKNIKKPKSTRDQIKELEEKIYGQKNKKKTESIRKQIEKLKLEEKLAKKKNDEKKILKNVKKNVVKDEKSNLKDDKNILKDDIEKVEIKRVCKFLLESQSRTGFICPDPNCKDIHSLTDMDDQLEIEEYLELCRCGLTDTTPLTKELFDEFIAEQEKINEEHERKKDMIRTGQMMFLDDPNAFLDDEDAVDLNYNEQCCTDEEIIEGSV
ncbi:hypothetical protein DMUE_2316 [Dictyocoela muelleri]|nr:hypothetical protein DMUE_2316 [Dictyocoela muelleri]